MLISRFQAPPTCLPDDQPCVGINGKFLGGVLARGLFLMLMRKDLSQTIFDPGDDEVDDDEDDDNESGDEAVVMDSWS